MKPLDKKDIVILSELLKDGRKSYSELAELIKLSVPATKSRVEKLIENGFINFFTINLDYTLLTEGRPSLISLKVSPNHVQKISDEMYSNKLVHKIFLTGGRYNLLLITFHITEAQKLKLINELQNMRELEDIETTILFEELPEKNELLILEPIRIKLICDFCKREFSDTVFTKVIGNKKRYFCCNTCLSSFEKRFERED
ncbi:MAG: winged helix-turn-helix transcriptional regulator [Candidatus Heimdallarchaeaceae archaeon]